MEKGRYQGAQPQIAAAQVKTIQPGLRADMRPGDKNVEKYEKLIGKRGNIVPVTATYAENGALALASGYEAFLAYQKCGAEEIPVIIAETADDSDALLLMLDMMITHPVDHLTVSTCLCKLIDEYLVPRRDIANILGKSLPWLSLAERIGRRLTPAVKEMLSNGIICMRAAEEIALLPAHVQKPFADRAVSLALNKSQVSRWVSLYTNKMCSQRDKDSMLNDPITYLKRSQKQNSPTGYALFCKALQRCKAAMRELAGITEALPDSAIDEAHAQLRELLEEIMNLLEYPIDNFTRVNLEGC